MNDRTRRLSWRIGLGVAVVGVVSVGAFGIAAASSSDQPESEPAPAEEHDGPPWAGHGNWGGGGPFGLFQAFEDLNVEDVSHAEVVLVKEGGGSTTMLVQKGTVTSVDASSIAVKSADGYTESYKVDAKTTVNGDQKIDTVAKDEQVLVVAPEGGDNPTAGTILDLTEIGWK